MSNQLDNLRDWEARYSSLYDAAMAEERYYCHAGNMGMADAWYQKAQRYKSTLEGIRAQIQEIEGS